MVSFSRYCHVGWWWGLSLKNINVSNYSGFFFSFDIFFKVSAHMQFSGWSLFGHKWDLQVYVKPQVDERDYASFTDNQVATSSLIELSNRIYESDKIGFWWFVFLIGIRQNAASCYHIMQVTFRRKQIKLCFHWSRAHLEGNFVSMQLGMEKLKSIGRNLLFLLDWWIESCDCKSWSILANQGIVRKGLFLWNAYGGWIFYFLLLNFLNCWMKQCPYLIERGKMSVHSCLNI